MAVVAAPSRPRREPGPTPQRQSGGPDQWFGWGGALWRAWAASVRAVSADGGGWGIAPVVRRGRCGSGSAVDHAYRLALAAWHLAGRQHLHADRQPRLLVQHA